MQPVNRSNNVLHAGSGALKLAVVIVLTALHAAPTTANEIELILGDVSMNKLPFVMALDEGIYERNGLDVTPKFSQGSVDIIRASGINVSDEYIHDGKSNPLVKIGGATPHFTRLTTRAGSWNPIALGSTHLTSRWRIVSRADIESPADLKGKSIGFSGVGAVTHYMAVSFAEHMGWDPDLDWSMMGGALGVDALDAGYVDAIIAPELHATMAVAAGYKILVDLGDYKLPVAGSAFLFDRQWLAGNKDDAERLIKSYVEAIALLKTDKQATFRALRKWFQMTDEDLMEFFYLEAKKLPSKPYPPYDGLKKMMEIYDSHEMRKYALGDFYDDSYVKALDDSGYIDSLYE